MKLLHSAAKKAIALLLVTLLLTLPFTVLASAADASGGCGSAVTWSYNETSKKLTIEGTGAMSAYKSADEIPWADYRAEIETVEIKAGVTSIGNYAFYYCTALKNLIAKEAAITLIGDYAFWMCTALDAASFAGTVKTVGKSAFAYCTALKSIAFSALESLGEAAFLGCTALTEVTLEGTLSRIESKTFMNCTSLSVVSYPDSVGKSIAEDTFKNCSASLTHTEIQSESKLTIHFLSTTGEVLQAAQVETLRKGESYSFVAPSFEGYAPESGDGYTVEGGIATVSGEMGGADREVKVLYKSTAPETEELPSEETTEQVDTEVELPKGPESVIAIVILVVILALIGVGAFFLIRSDKSMTKDSRTVRKNGNEKSKKK